VQTKQARISTDLVELRVYGPSRFDRALVVGSSCLGLVLVGRRRLEGSYDSVAARGRDGRTDELADMDPSDCLDGQRP
jgi:hypothetical protein